MNRPPSALPALLLATALTGAGCVVSDSSFDTCSPNPCRETHRTQCVEEEGQARCLCDSGFVARPSGACEPVSAANCAEHAGDAAEPDDCQARAQVLVPDTQPRQQSIDPIGDFDFFRLDGRAGHVYSVAVKPSGSLMARVDAFDQGGEYVGTAEHLTQAVLGFKARATAPYFLRVSHSPVDISAATGGYALTLTDVGTDDHGDVADTATSVTPEPFDVSDPTERFGRFEYVGDSDWFRFSASSSGRYRLAFQGPSGRVLPVVAVYTASDLDSPLLTQQSPLVDFTVPTSGTVFLELYLPGGQGSYEFQFFED